MARVDPEALEREAEELMRKAGLIPDPDAPPAPDTPETPDESPAPQADTDEPQLPATDDEQPRGEDEKPVDDEREIAVLRERYKNAQAAMTRATQRAAEAERGVAERDHTIAQLRSQLATPSGEGGPQAPASAVEADEAVRKALEEYPEIVGPLLKRLESVEATANTAANAAEDRRKEDAQTAHMSAIREKHSDLDQVVADPEFTGWVQRQSSVWQQIAKAGTAAEVIELLDRYKAAMGLDTPPPPQRESALDRARKVAEPTLPRGRKPDPNGAKRTWSRAEIGKMPLEEYEKHRDEIDRALAEGRVR